MGVPKFFRWISERYPCLSQVVGENNIPEFDNLYLDMNGIIHNCSHPDDDVHFRISEEQIIKDIFNYIEFLFNIIKPQKVFFLAVDGVAPRAKMNQQRGRRFRSAFEAISKEKEAIQKGQVLPKEPRFDSNCITPGTEFMKRVQAHLQYFIVFKISSDPAWRACEIILSGHETPGEGEHKIMDFIRYNKSQPNYNPNVRHCLYGLDSDLIMLGLASHEPHFSLLREEINFSKTKKKRNSLNFNSLNFYLLHLSLFRDYLNHEFSSIKTSIPFEYNLECIIDDWILMGFLCGNDFIPHIPHFHIHKNALSKLYSIYRVTLPELDGYLNEQGKLNLARFQKFVTKLAELDFENFNEINADLKCFESKCSTFKSRHNNINQFSEEIFEDQESPKLTNDLNSHFDLITLDSDEHNFDKEDFLDSEEENNLADEEFIVHKSDYYKTKLLYEKVDENVLKEQTICYIRALQWNLHYYYDGCKSWSWYYPHHYAPYISDVKDFCNIDLKFDLGKPFKPYEQLLAVLPPVSRNLLPKPYQRLLTDSNSPLKEYYPDKIELDMDGKNHSWEAIVVIPFIDEKKLLHAASLCESQLSEQQRKNNQHGPHLRFTFNPENLKPFPSSLPGIFPDILNNHANIEELDKDIFYLPINKIKKGLNPNIKLDVHFPGFPTLKHLEHRAFLEKAKVKIFQTPSQELNMLLEIKPRNSYNLNEIVYVYLGKNIYVNWPHLIEAKVVAISDGHLKFTFKNDIIFTNEVDEKGYREFLETSNNIETAFREKKGIIIGKSEILFSVQILTGYRYVSTNKSNLVLEKLWSKELKNFPFQTVVKDIATYAPDYRKIRTVDELFVKDSKCFLLLEQFYGDMAVVLETDKNGLVKVRISRKEEPDLTDVQNNIKDLINNEYMTHVVLSQKLQLNPVLVSRITGSIFVKKGESKVNIGLNLKFNYHQEEVPGYSKKSGDVWLFSQKTLKILEEYQIKFPKIFYFFNSVVFKYVYEAKEIFGSNNCDQKLDEVLNWIKSLPCSKVERHKINSETLDLCVVKAIEDVLDYHKAFGKTYDTIDLLFTPNLLYHPLSNIGYCPPDPSVKFNLFDRVVCVRQGIGVPLGSKGIIIGKKILNENNVENSTLLLNIVFDDVFPAGMTLNCSKYRGYQLHSYDVINISFKKKSQGYGVKDAYELSPIQNTWKERTRNKTYDSSINKIFGNNFKNERRLTDQYRHLIKRKEPYQSQTLNTQNKVLDGKNLFSMSSQTQNPSETKEIKETINKNNHDLKLIWTEMKQSSLKVSRFGCPEITSNDKLNPTLSSSPPVRQQSFHKHSKYSLTSHSPSEKTSPSVTEQKYMNKNHDSNDPVHELNQLCATLFKTNIRPQYKVSSLGPMKNTMATVILPNGTRYNFSLNPKFSKEKSYKQCALMTIQKLNESKNKNNLASSNLHLISTSVTSSASTITSESDPVNHKKSNLNLALPKPPAIWIPSPVQNNQVDAFKKNKIPYSFVEENNKILNKKILTEKKFENLNQHASSTKSHLKEQYDINYPSFQLSPSQRPLNRNIIVTQPRFVNPVSPFNVIQFQSSKHINNQRSNQGKSKPNPNQNLEAFENRFVPLQVARVNQANRLKNQSEIQIKNAPPTLLATSVKNSNNLSEVKLPQQTLTNSEDINKTKIKCKPKKSRMAINFKVSKS